LPNRPVGAARLTSAEEHEPRIGASSGSVAEPSNGWACAAAQKRPGRASRSRRSALDLSGRSTLSDQRLAAQRLALHIGRETTSQVMRFMKLVNLEELIPVHDSDLSWPLSQADHDAAGESGNVRRV
jgi:hypothetical protein